MSKIPSLKSLRLSWITAVILGVGYFCVYQSHLSHIIFYNEEHRLFLFSGEYLSHRLHWDGILSVLTDFIVQFFYYPWLGSLIMALLLVAIYALCHKMITAFCNDILQLATVPSILAFLYTESVERPLEDVVLAVLICLAIYLIIYIIRRFVKVNAKAIAHANAIAIISLVVYACAGTYYFWHHYNYSERRLLLVSRLAKQGDWEKVRHYTENFFQSGKTNNMMSYYYALALYNEGRLANEFMRYSKAIGPNGLYLAWQGSRADSEYGYLLYEQLGLISIAERWEFESMVVWGETAPHLINLARYNIVDGRPRVAQRFINILKHSLFYRSEAAQLEAALPTGKIEGLKNPLKGVKDYPAAFFAPTELSPNLEYLLAKDPTNKMAYEYLMCELILSNKLEDFAKYYPLATRFYQQVPQTFVEAMDYYQQNGSTDGKEVTNE